MCKTVCLDSILTVYWIIDQLGNTWKLHQLAVPNVALTSSISNQRTRWPGCWGSGLQIYFPPVPLGISLSATSESTSWPLPSLMANPYQRAIFVLREISKMILFEWWKRINEMFKTMFKSIFKFRIYSYFMYLKVLIENNMRLYFWKFLQIKNRTLVRMGH